MCGGGDTGSIRIVLASSRAERSGIVGQTLPLSSGGGEPSAGGRSAGSRRRAEDPGVGRIYVW